MGLTQCKVYCKRKRFLYLYLRGVKHGIKQIVAQWVNKSRCLTSNLERGMSTDGFAHVVFGHTPILSAVLLLLALHGSIEEEGAILEQYTM